MMNTPTKSIDQGKKSGETIAVVTPDGPAKGKGADHIEPHDNDVLCGRGGSINSHPGNERFRLLVEKRKRVYLTARFKREKRLIAAGIVSEIRSSDPPGRFLAKESKDGDWHDIGDDKARDKTSQALRENAPSIRAEIETEINQQRAEMQREEEAAIAAQRGYHQHWGGYFGSYYGHDYGAPPPPPLPHLSHGAQSHHDPSPPQGTGSHAPMYQQCQYDNRWGEETPQHSYGGPQHSLSQRTDNDETQKSAFEMPNFAGSVPSSFAAWTKSISFGGHSANSSADYPHSDGDGGGYHGHRKPLTYTHHPFPIQEHAPCSSDMEGQKRLVHFQDEQRNGGRNRSYDHNSARYYSDSSHGGHESHRQNNYSRDGHGHGTQNDMFSPIAHRKPSPRSNNGSLHEELVLAQGHSEPHMDFGETRQESSLLSQVANHILTTWDTASICAHGSSEMDDHSLFGNQAAGAHTDAQYSGNSIRQQDSIESEGQEVELVEVMDYEAESPSHGVGRLAVAVNEESRTPPPGERHPLEIDWQSQIGSCHNWIPDTLSTSAFFGSKGSFDNPLSPGGSITMTGSGEMDGVTSTGEADECASSTGGDSMLNDFKPEATATEQERTGVTDCEKVETNFESSRQRALSPIPSWERSFKSHSDADSNPSLISKGSEKSRDGCVSPITTTMSEANGHRAIVEGEI